ncbi:hypothetical protein TNCV_974481 [Trichonephila clavipes]|nr:hypothetical protein TNCV_974481 [Trichonephila clavipes]
MVQNTGIGIPNYSERKLLSGIDVSEQALKVSKMTTALDIRILPAPLKTLKSFLRQIFLELARHLQGRRFESADEVKSASQAELKNMPKNGFQKSFDELNKRWQKCAVVQGSYFEGRCVSAI